MRSPRHYIIQFLCVMAILFAIMLQGFTNVVKLKPLDGFVEPKKPVKLSFETYYNGRYQNRLTYLAQIHTGFRECFIRNYNQLCYTCFGKLNNTNVIVGNNGELFSSMYVEDLTGVMLEEYYSTVDSAMRQARGNVDLTLRLIDTLKQHGTEFLFVFAPSKAAVYPEYLPEPYHSRISDFSLIDYYIELFKENNIPFLDFHNGFKQMKDVFPYPLYAPYGTHWSSATIPLVADSILRKIEDLTGKKMPGIEITDLNISSSYSSQDGELESQFNLVYPLPKPPIPNPVFVLTDTAGAAKPNLLTVADSHFVLFENTCFLNAFNSWTFLRYNEYILSSHHEYDWKKIQFLPEAYQILEDADIVLAVFTAPKIYDYMFGFPEMALQLLEHGPLTDEESIALVIESIRDNQNWYDAVVKQAKEQGFTVEENLRRNAIYIIQTNKTSK